MGTIGFLGFGEAGSSIATGLLSGGMEGIVAYDIAWETSDLVQQRADRLGVELVGDPSQLGSRADVVISAVVCTEAEAAASAIAPHVRSGCWFLDINSVSPGVKVAIAAMMEPLGVEYVDIAVMSNVASDLGRLPLLAAGRSAAAVQSQLGDVELDLTVVSDRPGEAARIKMFRSLFVKGLEALSLEAMMACYPTGVHEDVLASLEGTFGKYSLPDLVRHLIERHAVHGARRANEMAEVAASLTEAGVDPIMATAAYQRMSWDVERGLQAAFTGEGDPDWLTVLAALERLRVAEVNS